MAFIDQQEILCEQVSQVQYFSVVDIITDFRVVVKITESMYKKYFACLRNTFCKHFVRKESQPVTH